MALLSPKSGVRRFDILKKIIFASFVDQLDENSTYVTQVQLSPCPDCLMMVQNRIGGANDPIFFKNVVDHRHLFVQLSKLGKRL